MPLLTQKKELPKGTIVPVRKIISRVSGLISFFTGKIQIVHNKVKLITQGIPLFIPSVLNENNIVKDQQNQDESFDQILDHPTFLAFFHEETTITNFYAFINHFQQTELDIDRYILESKVVTDAKWEKGIDELNGINGAMSLNIDTQIEIWEAVAEIRALPTSDSNQETFLVPLLHNRK